MERRNRGNKQNPKRQCYLITNHCFIINHLRCWQRHCAFMGTFLQNMWGEQIPKDLNQNLWGEWPVYQYFVLCLRYKYYYSVHPRLGTGEQTCLGEHSGKVLQGQSKKVSFQESRECGPASRLDASIG